MSRDRACRDDREFGAHPRGARDPSDCVPCGRDPSLCRGLRHRGGHRSCARCSPPSASCLPFAFVALRQRFAGDDTSGACPNSTCAFWTCLGRRPSICREEKAGLDRAGYADCVGSRTRTLELFPGSAALSGVADDRSGVDPLEAWLSSLEPRAELVARMALRSHRREGRADRNFFKRVATLSRELQLDAEQWNAVLADAQSVAASLDAPSPKSEKPGDG